MNRFFAGLGLTLLSFLVGSAPAAAQELLTNGSFETPAVTTNGNNFFASIAGWSVTTTAVQPQPFNIVLPWSGYAGNPTTTPSGGGRQYLDLNSTDGVIRQSVSIASPGMIDFSIYFSVRDYPQALSGCTINIRNSANAIVATASTSFAATDPIGLWKQASGANIPVAAGTYTVEVIIPDFANVDMGSLVWKPPLRVTKVSAAYSDPVNGTSNPKLIPGGVAEYSIAVTDPGSYSVTSNSMLVVDTTPANTDFVVSDIGSAGSGPAAMAAGSSGLTYTFSSLASTTDDVEFSKDSGLTWTYVPVANANGVDPLVTNVRLRPKGAMAAGSTATFRLRYRVR